MACACDGVPIPMHNARLAINHHVFHTGIPDRKDHAWIDAISSDSTHRPVRDCRESGEPIERALSSLRTQPWIHAALRAFVAVLRAVRGFFRACAAVFLALVAVLTTDGNSCLGSFAVR
jgi:hypothetical protein